jgi:hypothetical protein
MECHKKEGKNYTVHLDSPVNIGFKEFQLSRLDNRIQSFFPRCQLTETGF